MEDYPGLSRWAQGSHIRVLINKRERQEGQFEL